MDPYEIDWTAHAERLTTAAGQDRHWYARWASVLVEPGDRSAVDVGCGGGGMVRALSAALGPDGLVVGVDTSSDLLAAAAATQPAGPGRVRWVRADLDAGADRVGEAIDGPADVVWAAGAVHHLADQQAAVTALADLLAPGGRLALAEGGLPVRRLPWDLGVGEPGIELRLEAAQDRWFARMRATLPGSVAMPYGWTEALGRAGLLEVRSVSTLEEGPVPLPAGEVDRALAGLTDRIGGLRPTGLLEPADLAAWDRLLNPVDPAFLGRRRDLHLLEVRTVHVGRRGP